MKIISISNQKGGVGKTTTAVNLSQAIAATNRKTLLIDLDPQGNASSASGVKKKRSLFDTTLGKDISELIQTSSNQYDILAGGEDLVALEAALRKNPSKGYIAKSLKDLNYDFVFIDTPPSLNSLTLDALISSDGTLIPLQCEYYSLEGITSLVNTINELTNSGLTNNKIFGIIRTMVDKRNNLTKNVSDDLEQYFPDLLFNTLIPRNVKLAEAPSFGLAGTNYMPESCGSKAYLALAGELLRRLENVR